MNFDVNEMLDRSSLRTSEPVRNPARRDHSLVWPMSVTAS